MKQVKAIKTFSSPSDGTHKVGSVFYADDKRAEQLSKAGLAKVAEESETQEAPADEGGKRKA